MTSRSVLSGTWLRVRPLAAAALMVNLLGVPAAAPPASAQAPSEPLVVFVGDSITLGAEAEVPFAERLGGYNAGCYGATTRDFLRPRPLFDGSACAYNGAYQDRVAPVLPLPVAHVMLGVNDATGAFEERSTDPLELRENLLYLIARLRYDGARWIVLSVPPSPCPDQDQGEVADLLDAYRVVILGLTRSEPDVLLGADFSDLWDVVGEDGYDGCVHPAQPGHDHMAKVLAERFFELVPAP